MPAQLVALILLAFLGLCAGCGSDSDATPDPQDVARAAAFPVRLITDEVDAGTPPLLLEQLADGELEDWWLLDIGGASLAPAAGDPRVATGEDGVALTQPGLALVRFRGVEVDMALAASARVATPDMPDLSAPTALVQLHALHTFTPGETLADVLERGTTLSPGGRDRLLGEHLSASVRKHVAERKSEWIAPPDAAGFARARSRAAGLTDPHVRAIVLLSGPPGTVFGEVRLDRRPELDKIHMKGRGAGVDAAAVATGPVVAPVKVSGDRRLAAVVPPGHHHDIEVEVPAGARRLSFSVAILPGSPEDSESRWTVSVGAAGTPPTASDDGSVEHDPDEPILYEDVHLDWPAGLSGQVVVRFAVTGDAPVVFGLPMIRSPVAGGGPGPNLLVISIDTLRADHLGFGGYDRPTSPNLDGFAEQGVVFASAMSVGPYTLPTHVSLLTGLLPLRHGTMDGGADRLDGEVLPYLPRLLSEAGYATAAFTGGGFLSADYGFATGFDRFRNIDPIVNYESGINQQRYVRGQPRHAEELDRGAAVLGIADWIEEHEGERWFAFVHTYAVHDYQPPARDLELFDTQPDDPWGRDFRELQAFLNPKGWGEAPPEPSQVAHLENLYDATIHFADRRLAEFFERLEDRGLLENTVIVLTSDHGEEFLEHGALRHSQSLYEEMLHVPLVIHAPDARNGRTIREPVSGTDVAPTVLDLLGLPIPDGLDGRSLAPLVRGTGGVPDAPPLLIGHVHTLLSQRMSLQEGPLKLIRANTSDNVRHPAAHPWELYDKSVDPLERDNLVEQRVEDFERMRESMDRIEGILRAGAVSSGESELSPELLQQLAELGYLELKDE